MYCILYNSEQSCSSGFFVFLMIHILTFVILIFQLFFPLECSAFTELCCKRWKLQFRTKALLSA